jgi:VIT1/CCC1 family predicted Fe2+/Mn2+ transporter
MTDVLDVPARKHHETHLIDQIGWMRAAVLGANDGILSITSMIAGVAVGGASHHVIILTGLAGLVAGATSMATGEYVSVSSQSDIEHADLKREKREIALNRTYEQEELAQIYVKRGLDLSLARQVAQQMMAKDALAAHARDELGISEIAVARPLQAALSSAASFSAGAALPLLIAVVTPEPYLVWSLPVISLLTLILLGIISAKTGGVRIARPTLRILLWGAFSMAITALISHFVGVQLQ